VHQIRAHESVCKPGGCENKYDNKEKHPVRTCREKRFEKAPFNDISIVKRLYRGGSAAEPPFSGVMINYISASSAIMGWG
jgi:hypothetical protein